MAGFFFGLGLGSVFAQLAGNAVDIVLGDEYPVTASVRPSAVVFLLA